MSYDKSKANPELGLMVEEHLRKLNLHTPTVKSDLTSQEKVEKITSLMTEVLNTLGLDLTDDSLQDTPRRVAKMYVNEIFYGLDPEAFPKATAVENKMTCGKSFVLERGINVSSTCEHHLLPILGKAAVAYIPEKGGKVIGLSKMNRIVEYFSKRPQVQERLTFQIKEAMSAILETDNVAVYIDAKHTCVSTRGVEDTGSSTVTLATGGSFDDAGSPVRSEFLAEARKAVITI